MKKLRKRFLVISIIVMFAMSISVFSLTPVNAETLPLAGYVVALDAGHGYNGDPGAIGYCDTVAVQELSVNLTVRSGLTEALEAQGATVFQVPSFETRRDRVEAAEAAGADILISIHHNGSTDTSMDYTQTFITQKKTDKPLADAVHPQLVSALGLDDHGITSSGFGMTVFGDHPGILTEAYFITNTEAACDYLGAQDRVQAEIQGHLNGVLNYLTTTEVVVPSHGR